MQLLVRTTRQVALASAGATVLPRYRPMLEGVDNVTEDLHRAMRPDAGHRRLIALVSLAIGLPPQVIAEFRPAEGQSTIRRKLYEISKKRQRSAAHPF